MVNMIQYNLLVSYFIIFLCSNGINFELNMKAGVYMNMKRKALALLLSLSLLVLTTGCIHEEITYKLDKDGKGSISAVLTMSEIYSSGEEFSTDDFFGLSQNELTDSEGLNIIQLPYEETINGEKYLGTKIEMEINDIESFFEKENGDSLNFITLDNGNKRLEFSLSDDASFEGSNEEQKNSYAALKALNANINLNIETELEVIESNGTKLENGVYSWDLLDMLALDEGNLCYIEYKPGEYSTKDSFQPENVTASPTNAKVTVNGKEISFDAYNINGNNYFKLRDVAFALSGSEKQFEVEWDESKRAINLISDYTYSLVGGEMLKGDGVKKNGRLNKSPVYKDGEKVNLTGYNINGNNYFKLRDLGFAFDTSVMWDSLTKTIIIDTSNGYIQ